MATPRLDPIPGPEQNRAAEPGGVTFGPSEHDLGSCVSNCLLTHRVCLETAAHLLREQGDAESVRLLQTCSEICETSARFLILGSRFHALTCQVAAEVCEASAAECQKLPDDVQLRRCAEICRQCAESCREMAGRRGRAA